MSLKIEGSLKHILRNASGKCLYVYSLIRLEIRAKYKRKRIIQVLPGLTYCLTRVGYMRDVSTYLIEVKNNNSSNTISHQFKWTSMNTVQWGYGTRKMLLFIKSVTEQRWTILLTCLETRMFWWGLLLRSKTLLAHILWSDFG